MLESFICFICSILCFIVSRLNPEYLCVTTVTPTCSPKPTKPRRTYGTREPWSGFTPEAKAKKYRKETGAASVSVDKDTQTSCPAPARKIPTVSAQPTTPAPARESTSKAKSTSSQPDVLQVFRQFQYDIQGTACMAQMILDRHETPRSRNHRISKVDSTLRLRPRKSTICHHTTQGEVNYAHRAQQTILMKRNLELSEENAALQAQLDAKCAEVSNLEAALEDQVERTEYAEGKVEGLLERSEQMEDSYTSAIARVKELTAEILEIRQERDDAAEIIEEMVNSLDQLADENEKADTDAASRLEHKNDAIARKDEMIKILRADLEVKVKELAALQEDYSDAMIIANDVRFFQNRLTIVSKRYNSALQMIEGVTYERDHVFAYAQDIIRNLSLHAQEALQYREHIIEQQAIYIHSLLSMFQSQKGGSGEPFPYPSEAPYALKEHHFEEQYPFQEASHFEESYTHESPHLSEESHTKAEPTQFEDPSTPQVSFDFGRTSVFGIAPSDVRTVASPEELAKREIKPLPRRRNAETTA